MSSWKMEPKSLVRGLDKEVIRTYFLYLRRKEEIPLSGCIACGRLSCVSFTCPGYDARLKHVEELIAEAPKATREALTWLMKKTHDTEFIEFLEKYIEKEHKKEFLKYLKQLREDMNAKRIMPDKYPQSHPLRLEPESGDKPDNG